MAPCLSDRVVHVSSPWDEGMATIFGAERRGVIAELTWTHGDCVYNIYIYILLTYYIDNNMI